MRLSTLLALALVACSPTEAPTRCTPNVTIACVCPGGVRSGVQACDATGSGYGACQCAAPDGGTDDAAAAPDVVEIPDAVVTDTSCGTGRVRCGAACVDTLTDGTNCGTCGRVCGSATSCVSGTCQVGTDAGGMDAGADAGPRICPTSCSTTADCNPCRAPGDTSNHCCVSGQCLQTTASCPAPATDAGARADTPDARMMCWTPTEQIIVRCQSQDDCAACGPRMSGWTWCCGATGYCENRPSCRSTDGLYQPGTRLTCYPSSQLILSCRSASDCGVCMAVPGRRWECVGSTCQALTF